MSWLFPWFVVFACVTHDGKIVKDTAGPYQTELAAALVGAYLRYEAGCETGLAGQAIFWTSAISVRPRHYRHWKNLSVIDQVEVDALGIEWAEDNP